MPSIEIDIELADGAGWKCEGGGWKGGAIPMVHGTTSQERAHVGNGSVGEERGGHARGEGEGVGEIGVGGDGQLNENITLLDEAHNVLDMGTLADACDNGSDIWVGTRLDDIEQLLIVTAPGLQLAQPTVTGLAQRFRADGVVDAVDGESEALATFGAFSRTLDLPPSTARAGGGDMSTPFARGQAACNAAASSNNTTSRAPTLTGGT